MSASSDRRLKTDLKKIENAVDKVSKLSGYTYTRIDSGERHAGVIAQEVLEVLPEVVDSKGEYMAVAYGNMIALLIEAIKEQQVQITELKRRIS